MQNSARETESYQTRCILVVEDDPVQEHAMTKIVSEAFPNIQLDTARTGKEAIAKLDSQRFDIVLLDIALPDISGFDVWDSISGKKSRPRVIAVTVHSLEYAWPAGKRGLDGFLSKPFTSKAFVDQIKEQLDYLDGKRSSRWEGLLFCVMPFAPEYADLYLYGIKEVAEDIGFRCERVDEQVFTTDILARIQKSIRAADVIVADLTTNNPNVYYEVGYAHGKNKRVVLLCESADAIKFDLHGMRSIVHGGKIHTLREELRSTLITMRMDIREKRESRKRSRKRTG